VDILDRLVEHDADATRNLLAQCADLSDEQWHQTFAFGQGSLYHTFDHLVGSMEHWTGVMSGVEATVRPLERLRSADAMTQRFEAISPAFISVARKIRDENRLGDMFVDRFTAEPALRTFGACIVHVTTHSMHHRAQVLVMFDLLRIAYDPFAGYAVDEYPLDEE